MKALLARFGGRPTTAVAPAARYRLAWRCARERAQRLHDHNAVLLRQVTRYRAAAIEAEARLASRPASPEPVLPDEVGQLRRRLLVAEANLRRQEDRIAELERRPLIGADR